MNISNWYRRVEHKLKKTQKFILVAKMVTNLFTINDNLLKISDFKQKVVSCNNKKGHKILKYYNEIYKLRNVQFFADFFQLVSSFAWSDSDESDVDDDDDDKSSLNLTEKSSPWSSSKS